MSIRQRRILGREPTFQEVERGDNSDEASEDVVTREEIISAFDNGEEVSHQLC